MPGTPLIVHAEARAWLEAHPAVPGSSIVTSLPDVSEVSQLDFDAWRSWFVETASALIAWLPPAGVAIFYQSDIRHAGRWIDKSYLVQRAAEAQSAALLWHKIVCRKAPGSIALGRPSYSHMLCIGRDAVPHAQRSGPDVLPDAGEVTWTRGMGRAACELACRYLQQETSTRCVVDPFCGHGSVLRVALAMGFDVIGVDVSAKRCRTARRRLTLGLDASA